MARKPQRESVFPVLLLVSGLFALSIAACNTDKYEKPDDACPGNCVEGESNCTGDMLLLCRDAHWQYWENCANDHAICVFDGVSAYCEPLPVPDGGWYDTDTAVYDTDTSDTDTGAAR